MTETNSSPKAPGKVIARETFIAAMILAAVLVGGVCVLMYVQMNNQQAAFDANYTSLLDSKNNLQLAYNDLNVDHVSLQTLYNSLLIQKNNLQSNYTSLQSQYIALSSSHSILQTSYNEAQKHLNFQEVWVLEDGQTSILNRGGSKNYYFPSSYAGYAVISYNAQRGIIVEFSNDMMGGIYARYPISGAQSSGAIFMPIMRGQTSIIFYDNPQFWETGTNTLVIDSIIYNY